MTTSCQSHAVVAKHDETWSTLRMCHRPSHHVEAWDHLNRRKWMTPYTLSLQLLRAFPISHTPQATHIKQDYTKKTIINHIYIYIYYWIIKEVAVVRILRVQNCRTCKTREKQSPKVRSAADPFIPVRLFLSGWSCGKIKWDKPSNVTFQGQHMWADPHLLPLPASNQGTFFPNKNGRGRGNDQTTRSLGPWTLRHLHRPSV